MAVAVKLPDLGTNVEECKLLAWRVQEGETVKRGQALADIETDKAIVELESTAEGVLLRHTIQPNDMARTGDILAYVGQAGESAPTETADKAPASAAAPATASAPEPSAPLSSPSRVSPIVRNLAAKLGVDLGAVRGTGQNGTITRDDVLRASKATPSASTAPEQTGEAMSRGQLAVAKAVTKSWREIPHFYVSTAVDMRAAKQIREKSKSSEERPSYDALFLKAMALAIKAVPLVAAKLEGERVTRPQGIHVALAIGSENELFLPVIRDVDQKDLRALQQEIAGLVAKTREGALKPEQMTGASIALSNLGMYPVSAFEGIIFPGHSAILTVGTIEEKPAVVDGRIEIRPLLTATVGADHRLINGRVAAEFLTKFKEAIESGNFA